MSDGSGGKQRAGNLYNWTLLSLTDSLLSSSVCMLESTFVVLFCHEPVCCLLTPHAYSESVVGVRQVWLAAHSESKAWDSPCTVAGGKIILFRVTIFSCHHLTFCPRARCFYLKVCFYLKGGGWAVCSSILPDTRMPHSLTRTDWISHLTAITFCQASPNPIAVPKPFLA